MQIKITLDSISSTELTIDDLRELYNQLHELFSSETIELRYDKTEPHCIQPYWRREFYKTLI